MEHSSVVVDGRSPLIQDLADVFSAKKIASELGYFADSEILVKIENKADVKGNDVFFVFQYSTMQGRGSFNDQLLQSLFFIQQIMLCGPRRVVVVSPYLPYARQCENVDKSAAGPFKMIGDFYRAAGVDEVISIELHENLCEKVFSVPLSNIHLDGFWESFLLKKFDSEITRDTSFVEGGAFLKNSLFLSPDKGGRDRVCRLAAMFGAPTAYVEKKRTGYNQSVAMGLVGDVAGRVVFLVDDVVDTASTAVHAADLAIKEGAERVFACFTHPVLSEGAIELLEKSKIEKIWVCNTLEKDVFPEGGKISMASINDYFIEAICRKIA